MQQHKTYVHRKEDVERQWHLVDVEGQILGRVATQIAQLLIGKHKPTYTPHVDGGDYVVVVNASQVELTRRKALKKVYKWHTGFPGGIKERSFTDMLAHHPEKVIGLAVKNMLPKNKHRQSRMARLKVYPGLEHPHQTHFNDKKTAK